MFLKSDFDAKLQDAVVARPAAAAAYRAGDPRLLAQMEAMATMLAMLSAQVDVAEVEPFIKARTGTVLADASLKGMLPLAKPAKVRVAVVNPGASPVSLDVGRVLLDGKGRAYVVDGSAVVPAAGTASVTAQQLTTREVLHTVTATAPFYELRIGESEEGAFLTGMEVSDGTGAFTYAPDYCNVAPGDRVFHVETDEYRRLAIRFGARDENGAVVGHQPLNGDNITVTVSECAGRIELETGAQFALDYVGTTADAELRLTLAEVLSVGANPPTTDELRVIARYPALHDANAVFLSNFDFLLRRHLSGIQFLSVWNEQVEEAARGPSLLHVNKLFVAYVLPDQTAETTEGQVRAIVARADNSYRVVFVPPRTVAVPVTVAASVAAVHDSADVAAQVRAVLLAEYGIGSVAASKGQGATFRLQYLQDVLRRRVPALQDQVSDFSLVLGDTGAALPEDFRHFTAGSITVNVTRARQASGLWGA